MEQEIGIKTIVILFNENGKIMRIERRTDLVSEYINKIYESVNTFRCLSGEHNVTLIINEVDFEFISHYHKISGNIRNVNNHSSMTLMGMKVLKMKQPGFIISYE